MDLLELLRRKDLQHVLLVYAGRQIKNVAVIINTEPQHLTGRREGAAQRACNGGVQIALGKDVGVVARKIGAHAALQLRVDGKQPDVGLGALRQQIKVLVDQ